MKVFRLALLLIIAQCTARSLYSQNILMNILTRDTGIVHIGKVVMLEITVCNTSAVDSVPEYKLKPQISVPGTIAGIPEAGHILPAGWKIVSNDGATIRISNGTDRIEPNVCRTILIAIKGNSIGGPLTVSGNLLFSNGTAPGSAPGSATAGDNPADNNSTSTCQVIK
jgi:hypothetical protein